MKNLKQIKIDFTRIKNLGYVSSSRPNNKDGGIGNTYEDLLGVKENNLKSSDHLGYEIKSKRLLNSTYISLFSKSPSFPQKANSILLEKYGEIRDSAFPNKKKLYASVFSNRYSLVYNKYKMKLSTNDKSQKLYLKIYNLNNKIIDKIYWQYSDLKESSLKMTSLLLVLADERIFRNKSQFHFKEAEVYNKFNFDSFIQNIKDGNIMFDLRIGVYSSGKNYGKTHDHGSGFRIKKENFENLYEKKLKLK